ncbi:MAG: LLM class flavin-dependent oxidoreductase [Dehalococcoidia bacterium]
MIFTGTSISGATVAHHVAAAKAAEESGYNAVWVAEVQGPDAVTALAAVACSTSRITLATGILPTYVRDPFLTAMTLHSLQELSGGRMAPGFGTSTAAIVAGWHGIPFERPIRHTREYVSLVKRLLAGERVKSEGLFNLRGAVLRNAATPAMPIYLAGLGPQMLELAGEIADGVILNFPTLGYTERALASVDRGLAKAGKSRKDFRVFANFRTCITDIFENGANPLKRELITYFLAPVYQSVFREDGYAKEVETVSQLWAAGDRAGAIAAIPDAFADGHGVIGQLHECEAKVQRYLDAGIDEAVLFPVVPDGQRGEAYIGTIRAFGQS